MADDVVVRARAALDESPCPCGAPDCNRANLARLVPELVEEVERLRAVLTAEYARAFHGRDGRTQHWPVCATHDEALSTGSTISSGPVEVRWCTPWEPVGEVDR